MAKLISYEEFEKGFKDNEPPLNKVQQARRNRILKISNQIAREMKLQRHKGYFIKWELERMDIQSIQIIENLSQKNLIKGKPTNTVYNEYQKICNKCGFNGMNKIVFSRYVVKYFDYSIIDKKVSGKKYRIFI